MLIHPQERDMEAVNATQWSQVDKSVMTTVVEYEHSDFQPFIAIFKIFNGVTLTQSQGYVFIPSPAS